MNSLLTFMLTLFLGLGLCFNLAAFADEATAKKPNGEVNPGDINFDRDNVRLGAPPTEMAATVNAPGVDCPECRKYMKDGEHSALPTIVPVDGAAPPAASKGSMPQPQKQ